MSLARHTAEPLLRLGAELGEGPVWLRDRNRFACVDIEGRRIHEFDTAGGAHRSYDLPDRVGLLAPSPAPDRLIVGLGAGIAPFDLARGTLGSVVTPAEHDPARARFNDGKPDPQGRLWAGTMGLRAEPGAGAFYRFAPGEAPRRVLRDVTVSNGLAWNAAGDTLYYIDSATWRVDAFDFDGATGTLDRRRVAFAIPADCGKPDGCAIDCEDRLWIAHLGTGQVLCWDPIDGRPLAAVAVPGAPRVSSCAFGGPRLDLLVVTTMRRGLDAAALEAAPHAGDVFIARPGAIGPAPSLCHW